jgi:hypothetical protein
MAQTVCDTSPKEAADGRGQSHKAPRSCWPKTLVSRDRYYTVFVGQPESRRKFGQEKDAFQRKRRFLVDVRIEKGWMSMMTRVCELRSRQSHCTEWPVAVWDVSM